MVSMLVFAAVMMNDASTTDLLVAEAKRRSITAVIPSPVDPHTVVLELADHREAIYFSSTDRLGRVTFRIFLHKPAASALLRRGGFPVPAEIITDEVSAIEQFLKQYEQIVIKPLDSVWGQGVTPGIVLLEDIPPAVTRARARNSRAGEQRIICQEYVTGQEYRILVIDQQHVFAVHRIPAHVIGDGHHTVAELIDQWNASVRPERRIVVTSLVTSLLAEQGLRLDQVPLTNVPVQIRRVANAHAGGIVHDATQEVGESVRTMACAVAQYFNVPVVGIDCITSDISKDMGFILELNSTPDITLHHFPTEGEPQDVAGCIVDMLFPETAAA